jgi:multidrug transporter EmrE-like cation transporter
MDSALNISMILAYSIFGAGSATLVKISLDRISGGRLLSGATVFAAAFIVFALALLCLFALLHKMPVSLIAPITIGSNLLLTSLAARLFLTETISRAKVAANGLIIIGITVLAVSS